jgi:hypothetical protein
MKGSTCVLDGKILLRSPYRKRTGHPMVRVAARESPRLDPGCVLFSAWRPVDPKLT